MRTSPAAKSHVTVLASRAAESLGELAQVHVSLARAELLHDLRGLARDAALLALAAPLLGLGYVLMCGALVSALTPWVGQASGLAIVGGINLTAGGVAAWRAAVSLRTPPRLLASVGADLADTARDLLPTLAATSPTAEVARGR